MASLALGFVGEPAFDVVFEAALGTTLSSEVTHGLSIALRLGATVAQAERVAAESGRDRLLIVGSGPHHPFVGYVHTRDLVGLAPGARPYPLPADFVRTMAIIRSDRSLIEVLRTPGQASAGRGDRRWGGGRHHLGG